MDGHSSHYTPELLKYARDNNIIILGYPPHCTHTLQGLNVVCFARMKGDFTEVFRNAFHKAFTVPTVLATFKKTRIRPYNPNVITPPNAKGKQALISNWLAADPNAQPCPCRHGGLQCSQLYHR